jgi:hypothetical protein
MGGVEDASLFRNWSSLGIRVIDLDATELPSNDWEIFEAVEERVLADLVESEFEVPGDVASAVAAFADAGATSDGAPALGAIVLEQPMPDQGGDVGHPVPSITSKEVEGVLREPAAGAESAVIAPPLPTAGADESATEGA